MTPHPSPRPSVAPPPPPPPPPPPGRSDGWGPATAGPGEAPPHEPTPPRPTASEDGGRSSTASAAAAWIGVLGAALLLLGSAIVLTQSWPTHGEVIRAVALVAGAGLAALAAERFRRSLPVTSAVDAHIGTFLVAPAGIAVASAFGATWPTCTVIGGVLAAAATEVQSRRWRRDTMLAGQVVALTIASVGGGALTPLTAAAIAVLLAAAFEAAGAHHRATALAAVAASSPMLWVCARLGHGPGTLDDAGIIGARLDWSRPLVGLVAGAVFAAVAIRTRRPRLWAAAIAAPVLSGGDHLVGWFEHLVDLLDRHAVTATDWMAAITSAVLLAVGWAVRRSDDRPSTHAYGPGLTVLGLWLVLTVAGRNPAWALPLAITLGVAAAGSGAWFRLTAPLVGGTAIVTLSVLAASWDSITSAPTWVWLSVGGLLLLAVGVVIEQRGDRGRPDVEHLLDGWS